MEELEKIIYWKLNENEIKAYKLSLLWMKLLKKHLSKEEMKIRLSKGDPRKTFLFKVCWKLLRETKGILKEEDYYLYLTAQIVVLKSIHKNGIHANISENCIVGERAWKRWKWFKYKYKEREFGSISENYLIKELDKSYNFIVKHFGDLPKQNQITIQNLKDWIDNENISPIYVILSPFSSILLDGVYSKLGFDPKVYDDTISSVVIDYFHKKFPNEFKD